MGPIMANSKRNARVVGASFAHDHCTNKWKKAYDVIAQIEASTADAIKCLQDENSVIVSGPPYQQTSESKKKVAVKRALNRLGRVVNDLSTMETYTADLEEEHQKVRKKLEASETTYKELEDSTSNMREELETCQAKLKETISRLHNDEERIKTLSKELEVAKLSAEVASKDRMAQERMRAKDADKGSKVRMDEFLQLVAREESLRAENEKLKKGQMAALREKEAQEDSLLNASLAVANVERYKEVIAKVTADNMVFLMKVFSQNEIRQRMAQLVKSEITQGERVIKYRENNQLKTLYRTSQLKQSEAALSAAQARLQDLQSEVNLRRGHWLDEASAEVQGIILDSLRKAEECESKLHDVETQRGKHVHEWEEKLKAANGKLAQVIASRDWHEKNVVEISQKYKTLEDEKLRLQQKFESEGRHRHHAEAESRALMNTLRETNEKLAGVNCEFATALKEIEDKRQQLFEKDLEVNDLLVQLEKVNSQLETQLKVNGVLMKKKEAVEWELMEAQAQRD